MQTAGTIQAQGNCWACGKEIAGGRSFCDFCGKVQPPREVDSFEVFGLPRRLTLDPAALEQRFYRLSRKLHPDLYARAGEREQQWSLAQASLLNDAYRTLKNPVERTRYLLQLEGVRFEDDRAAGNRSASPPTNSAKAPADLLEEVFELNMQLEQLRMMRKGGEDDPALRQDLTRAAGQFAAQLDALDRDLQALWSRWDDALEQGDEERMNAAKEQMTALLQRRNYLRNLVREVDQAVGEF